MTELNGNIVIQVNENDNVGVAANSTGLKEGSILQDNIRVRQYIPMGHKVALQNIGKGEKIVRYGQTIGYAKDPIPAGTWINESNITLPESADLETIPLPGFSRSKIESLEGYTFMGYRNKDGSVGTKNILGIVTSVQCVAGFTQIIVNKIKNELLPEFPNVDDVVALNHTYGCGVAINAPDAIIPVRTIRNLSTNPNFGDEVLIVGLGCEKLRPETLLVQSENGPEKTKPGGLRISCICRMNPFPVMRPWLCR